MHWLKAPSTLTGKNFSCQWVLDLSNCRDQGTRICGSTSTANKYATILHPQCILGNFGVQLLIDSVTARSLISSLPPQYEYIAQWPFINALCSWDSSLSRSIALKLIKVVWVSNKLLTTVRCYIDDFIHGRQGAGGPWLLQRQVGGIALHDPRRSASDWWPRICAVRVDVPERVAPFGSWRGAVDASEPPGRGLWAQGLAIYYLWLLSLISSFSGIVRPWWWFIGL